MNAKRRKALKAIITRLEELESIRCEIQEQLEEIIEEGSDSLENMPEGLQESERGQQMQKFIDTMESANGDLDCLDIESIVDQLSEIAECRPFLEFG